MDEYPDDPFKEVPQVEEDIQHLPHLQCVDVLVLCYHYKIPFGQGAPLIFPDEDSSEQIDCEESSERNVLAVDYFHSAID